MTTELATRYSIQQIKSMTCNGCPTYRVLSDPSVPIDGAERIDRLNRCARPLSCIRVQDAIDYYRKGECD